MKRPAPKRCPYCGGQYIPYIRAVKTQKSCGKARCRKKQKRESQSSWLERNPDYFRGRYIKVKRWRDAHPGYQRKYRAANPEQVVRDNRARLARWHKRKRFRSEIQDGLFRRRIARIQAIKGTDIQETLNLKVDGIIAVMSG